MSLYSQRTGQVGVAVAFAEAHGYRQGPDGSLVKDGDRCLTGFVLQVANQLGWERASLALRIRGPVTFGTMTNARRIARPVA